jgi:hypothetical protein
MGSKGSIMDSMGSKGSIMDSMVRNIGRSKGRTKRNVLQNVQGRGSLAERGE